jgi:hypothetical protein
MSLCPQLTASETGAGTSLKDLAQGREFRAPVLKMRANYKVRFAIFDAFSAELPGMWFLPAVLGRRAKFLFGL